MKRFEFVLPLTFVIALIATSCFASAKYFEKIDLVPVVDKVVADKRAMAAENGRLEGEVVRVSELYSAEKANNSRQSRRLARLRNIARQQAATIRRQNADIEQKDGMIRQLKDTIFGLDDLISELDAQIEELQNRPPEVIYVEVPAECDPCPDVECPPVDCAVDCPDEPAPIDTTPIGYGPNRDYDDRDGQSYEEPTPEPPDDEEPPPDDGDGDDDGDCDDGDHDGHGHGHGHHDGRDGKHHKKDRHDKRDDHRRPWNDRGKK